MIVADTNLLAYLVVPGPSTRQAEYVRAREKVWVAPALMPYEFLNVLSRHMRRRDFSRDEAGKLFRSGIDTIEVSVLRPEPLDVLRLVERSNCTTYDMEFVWLAREPDVRLVIADREVLNAFPNVAVDFESFA